MQPYYGKNNQEVIEEVIRKRNLLERPENCPINIYNIMLECWNEVPLKRPNFTEIHSRLRNLKAVYSNSCITASSVCNNNNLNNSGYEVFEQLDQQLTNNNKLDTLNLSNAKSRNENIVDSNQIVNSNSCGNLLYQQNSDSTTNNNSPCLNKLSIFKQSKTVDKSE